MPAAPPIVPPPTPDPPPAAPERPPRALDPLREGVFRTIWIATLVSNVGTWMQIVGAAWEMTRVAPSPLFVALMSTATSLPVFLLGFPAGVLADSFDRRRYIIACQVWMMLATGALAVLAAFDGLTAWSLLGLTFALGIGNAMNGPAWQAVVPEIVGYRLLPQAVALNSAGFNVARTVGPAIGGLIYAAGGAVALFAANAATFLAVIAALTRWRRAPVEPERPREGFLAGLRSGLAYVRSARDLQHVLLRSVLFCLPAGGLMSMLPLVAREELNLDAAGFGGLYSAFGGGAVAGAFLMTPLSRHFGPRGAILVPMAAFALAMAGIAAVPDPIFVGLCVAVAGAGWICVLASNNVAAQNILPGWVRARGLATYQMSFFGSLALGGALWGKITEWFGVQIAVAVAAVLLMLATLAVHRLMARQPAAG